MSVPSGTITGGVTLYVDVTRGPCCGELRVRTSQSPTYYLGSLYLDAPPARVLGRLWDLLFKEVLILQGRGADPLHLACRIDPHCAPPVEPAAAPASPQPEPALSPTAWRERILGLMAALGSELRVPVCE